MRIGSVSFGVVRTKQIATLATIICVIFLPKLLITNEPEEVQSAASESITRQLFLKLVDTTEKNKPINAADGPIAPSNTVCSEYLAQFINSTTDEADECEGFENAWQAARCEEIPLRSTNYAETNSNSTDDDSFPDDYMEKWRCCRFIDNHYSRQCVRAERLASLSLLGIVSVLILCAFVKTLIQGYQLHWLPEAGGCILVGAAFGTVLRILLPNHEFSVGTFDDDLFLFILLPPIIFNASLSIDKAKFRSCLFPIAMFAIFGTILSSIITGFIVYGITNIESFTTPIPLLDSMIFGALISSVDPVATLSVLGSMGVSDTEFLYVVVFGESILNDGVSIALFESLVLNLDENVELDGAIVLESTLFFLKVTSASVAIGLACGILCTIYFWCLRGRQSPVSEVATFFCFALLAYYISDSLNCSGIVAIMVAGFFMDMYVRGRLLSEADLHRQILQSEESGNAIDGGAVLPPRCGLPSVSDWKVIFCGVGHISNRAKVHVGFVSEVISNLMETSIFAYLGIFLFGMKTGEKSFILQSFLGIFSSVVSRLIMIAVISVIINAFLTIRGCVGNQRVLDNSDHHTHGNQTERGFIDRHMLLILLYSGVRGAVSLALVDNIPVYNNVTKHGSKVKPALKAMTCSSILFTVFIFGALTYRTLKKQRDMINNPRGTERDTELPLCDRSPSGQPIADSSLTSLLLEEVSQEVRS